MVDILKMQKESLMRTKDFIYYASAAVLLAGTTQVAHDYELAT